LLLGVFGAAPFGACRRGSPSSVAAEGVAPPCCAAAHAPCCAGRRCTRCAVALRRRAALHLLRSRAGLRSAASCRVALRRAVPPCRAVASPLLCSRTCAALPRTRRAALCRRAAPVAPRCRARAAPSATPLSRASTPHRFGHLRRAPSVPCCSPRPSAPSRVTREYFPCLVAFYLVRLALPLSRRDGPHASPVEGSPNRNLARPSL
jgi:hypothetical protein